MMNNPLSRREFLTASGALAALFLAGCTEQKPARTLTSAEHPEFFSNGAVLNLDSRLKITADPDRLNALVNEPAGGLKLPEDYIISTLILPIRPSEATYNRLLALVPKTLEPAILAHFPKQLARRKHTVGFLFSQEAVDIVMAAYISGEYTKRNIDLNKEETLKKLSSTLSILWFLGTREQFASETGLPKPQRQLPGKIAELINKNPPIEVIGLAEGAKFTG